MWLVCMSTCTLNNLLFHAHFLNVCAEMRLYRYPPPAGPWGADGECRHGWDSKEQLRFLENPASPYHLFKGRAVCSIGQQVVEQ